ncbi:MAG: T9SS C-terminal target domain-containing protein [Bacteroidia bacterium]|nr:T9SS C-terminal target domain-containing protein [Bacteroidia bacterium]
MKQTFVILSILFSSLWSVAQTTTFSIRIEEDSITGMPGLQSFVRGTYLGKWILIGGRTDGLHRRQPWASFDPVDNNTTIYQVDPVGKQVWSASISSLPVALQEQLQSTNMCFAQRNNTLYVLGGYGYSATAADHITYDQLVAIDLAGLSFALEQGLAIAPHFRYLTDSRLGVTGGHLGRLDSVFYLAGGQRFTGRYNPMNNPTFVQEYTNEVRRFTISDDGTNLSIGNYSAWRDTTELHRRDYNMLPQVFPNGERGFTMFSGVFQHLVDLPWLNTVDLTPSGYTPVAGFSQYLSQYHSAKAALWDSSTNTMHSLFFGGISRYTLDTATGTLLDDPNVPFVRTISRVTRYPDGAMTEYAFPETMPVLTGSGAEFFPVESLPMDEQEILRLDLLPVGETVIGHIVGGIESSQPNIFFINTGVESVASARLYRVVLDKEIVSSVNDLSTPAEAMAIRIGPNPAESEFQVELDTKVQGDTKVELLDLNGKVVRKIAQQPVRPGRHRFNCDTRGLAPGRYQCRARCGAIEKQTGVIVK